MKAVARLIWTYFFGAPVLRWFSMAGLVLCGINLYILMTQPQSGEMLWIAIIGIMTFFVGSSHMPMMFGSLARGHTGGILPGARVKLLASAFLTVVLVCIPVGIMAPAGFVSATITFPELMKDPRAQAYVLMLAADIFTSAMILAGWLYLAMWFMTSERNMVGGLKALFVIAVMMFAPAREIRDSTVMLSENLQQLAVVWIVFGAGFLLWPRFKAAQAARNRAQSRENSRRLSRAVGGREFALMLGTANPWPLIAPLVLIVFISARFVHDMTAMWLYVLTIFSTVSGATAGEAAGRSRALWLRGDWSREELFARVEGSFWRHNGFVLATLILLLAGIGSFAGFSAKLYVAGFPLLILGTVLSTYLGLMVTRGLRAMEIVLGSTVMVALMAVSVLVVEAKVDMRIVVAIEICLAALAVVLRTAARRRWVHIDWMQCRSERMLSARGA